MTSDSKTAAVPPGVAPPPTTAAVAPRRLRLARLRDLALVPAILLIGVIGAFSSSTFLTRENLTNVLQQQSEISLVVLAEAMILICGRLDLSLESTIGLAPGLAAWLILPSGVPGGQGVQLSGAWAVPITLGAGAVIGALNGLMIVRYKLNAFVVTLGMLVTLRGLLLGVSKGATFANLPSSMIYLGSEVWWGVPASVWISLSLFATGIIYLGYFRHGRSLYAIGGNVDAARAAGIRTDRVLWLALIAASTLAALAGLLLAGRLQSVGANLGDRAIFTVFAACVIGGVSLDGGRGTIFGAFSGILLLYLVQNVLQLAGAPVDWLLFLNGVIILAALIISRIASGEEQT